MIAGKWKVRVLYLLSLDELSFNELRHSVGNISQQVLSSVLTDLAARGIVCRAKTALPRETRHALTGRGRELVGLLQPLAAWGNHLLSESGAIWNPPQLPQKRIRADRHGSASAG